MHSTETTVCRNVYFFVFCHGFWLYAVTVWLLTLKPLLFESDGLRHDVTRQFTWWFILPIFVCFFFPLNSTVPLLEIFQQDITVWFHLQTQEKHQSTKNVVFAQKNNPLQYHTLCYGFKLNLIAVLLKILAFSSLVYNYHSDTYWTFCIIFIGLKC